MTSLGLALQEALPGLHPAETAQTSIRKVAYLLRKAPKQDKRVRGTDGVVRRIAGIIFPEDATDALSWARERVNITNGDGKPACDVFILGITLKDGACAYEVRVRKGSGTRVKHLAVRLRKEECRAQEVNVPREIRKGKFQDLLIRVGQPDFKGIRNWFWDFDNWMLKSVGTSRLTYEKVFTTVADCLAESLGVV